MNADGKIRITEGVYNDKAKKESGRQSSSLLILFSIVRDFFLCLSSSEITHLEKKIILYKKKNDLYYMIDYIGNKW